MGTVEELLATGWHFKRTGDHLQAEHAYRRAVQVNERHPEAWAGLGTFCLQRGRLDEAIEHLRRALELRADDANACCNLGIALANRGRLPEAVASFAEAVRLNPTNALAHANLGNALRETGKLDEAVTSLRAALILQPNNGAAHLNLGLALTTLRQRDEAIRHLHQAIQFTPTDARAHNALGLAFVEREDWAAAAACFERVCRLQPTYPDAHANLGIALARHGNAADAVAWLREGVQQRPDSPETLNALGASLAQLGDFRAALAPLQEALRLRPDYLDALVNLGDVLRCCSQHDEAAALLHRALTLDSANADGHHNLALIHADHGRIAEAMSEFHEALRLRPDCPAYHNNRALIWLRLGEWRKGWDEFEWRWQCRGFSQPNFTQPRWDGGDLAGKTILLWAEQGLGDTLQFVRYAAVLKERGATVVVECPAVLHPLLAECSGINRLIARAADRPAFDVHAPLMSLPGLVGTAVDTVPGPNPYLSAKPDLVTHWQQELKPIAGFRIGVCWQGSTKFTGDWLRSFPLSQLAPLAAVPGVRLVSLQKGHGVEQLAASAGRLEIVDLGSKLDQTGGAFLDTAAVIKNLDLVVTCDTAIGHLAGALGAPVWLALSRSADWRWLLDRTDTPWYPTMRLFRQKELGKWEDVFAEMARELNGALHSSRRARPVMTEIAPGELVDKITILELKSEYIRNADKLRNVAHELRLLRATHAEALPPSAQLSQLTTELKAVNAALWDIEDAIRDCERRGDFGPRFIELARSVYRQNDRRAALKRSINDLLGSRVVEEKAYAAY